MRTSLILSLVLCMVCILVTPAEALKDRVTDEMIDQAMIIATLKVIALEESQQIGNTYYTVQLLSCSKGSLDSSTMLVRAPKTYLPSKRKKARKTRKLDVGQQATLYLETGPQGITRSSIVLALVPIPDRVK